MTYKYLTTEVETLAAIEEFTDATQTVLLSDGRYAFCDGEGAFYANAVVWCDGFEMNEVEASAKHTDAHQALETDSRNYPAGSRIVYRNRIA